jgi:membrane fusion protein (multidrug efflux system)
MKRSHWIIFLVICAVLGLLVFKTVLHMINTDTKKAELVHAPSPVETVPARQQPLDEVIGGNGAIEQSETVQLTAQITTQVREVRVKIGDLVKKGDLLVSLDDRLIQATLQANRDYVEADNVKIKDETRQVERYRTLEARNMGTPLEFEKSEMSLADAKEALAKATLSLRQAEIDLEHSKMIAPLDGIVLERLINPGETTRPDQILIKLGSLQTVLMVAKIAEEKMHAVQLKLPAEVSFPAFPGETFAGEVVKIDPNIDPLTRAFSAYVEVKNPDLRIKPGLSGFARIRRAVKSGLAVPSVAIMNPSGEQGMVFVVDDFGRARLRKVTTGNIAKAMTEITSGLKEGEKVVTVGQLYIKDNEKVHTSSLSNP